MDGGGDPYIRMRAHPRRPASRAGASTPSRLREVWALVLLFCGEAGRSACMLALPSSRCGCYVCSARFQNGTIAVSNLSLCSTFGHPTRSRTHLSFLRHREHKLMAPTRAPTMAFFRARESLAAPLHPALQHTPHVLRFSVRRPPTREPRFSSAPCVEYTQGRPCREQGTSSESKSRRRRERGTDCIGRR